MLKEYKNISIELKADEKNNSVEGYAAIFDNVDSHKDIIRKGSFKKTISENLKRIKLMRNHYQGVIGVPTHLEEDSKGLYFKGKVSNTDLGKETLILIKDGVLSENSIGYRAIKYHFEEDEQDTYGIDPFRVLTELKLMEISVVDWGSNEEARIVGVKSDDYIQQASQKLQKFESAIKNNVGILDNKQVVTSLYEDVKSLLDMAEPSLDTRTDLVADYKETRKVCDDIGKIIKLL